MAASIVSSSSSCIDERRKTVDVFDVRNRNQFPPPRLVDIFSHRHTISPSFHLCDLFIRTRVIHYKLKCYSCDLMFYYHLISGGNDAIESALMISMDVNGPAGNMGQQQQQMHQNAQMMHMSSGGGGDDSKKKRESQRWLISSYSLSFFPSIFPHYSMAGRSSSPSLARTNPSQWPRRQFFWNHQASVA